MSADLAVSGNNNLATRAPQRERLAFVPKDFDDAWRQAEVLSKVGIFPDYLKGKPHDILATIITGAELGLSPMQSVRDIVVVKGKGFIQSALKVALVKQSPLCEYFRMVESSATRAVYETSRIGEGKTRYEYTIEMAQTAGLASQDNYRKDPAGMLRARCSGKLAEIVYSDVTRGIGDKDDIAPAVATPLNPSPTFAPPPPSTMEDAQIVAPTPPAQPVKTEAPIAPVVAQTVTVVAEVKPTEPTRQREPGDDDDVPVEQPVTTPAQPPQQAAVEPDSDLAIYAAAKAATTEAELDALSPKATRIQGPLRREISDIFIEKRKAFRAAKAGK